VGEWGGEGRGVNRGFLRELVACNIYATRSVKADRKAELGNLWTWWGGKMYLYVRGDKLLRGDGAALR
jgi:hypothetical protein